MEPRRLDFGIFLAPFHRVGENPTYALQRDMELIRWLDHLGYDEAWIGEHHSAGYEIIASPEMFCAAAGMVTQRIRLGTGVNSLPYHHPLLLADRLNQLDHMLRGRGMFGVGPGALPSDAWMLGIDPIAQRARMDEALNVILRLFTEEEPFDHEADWFTMREGRLQMRPFTKPHIETAVASLVSPSGAKAAGRHGLGLLSIGATNVGGFDALGHNWQIATDVAAAAGRTADRRRWRLVGPMHIAATREQARQDVEFGLHHWIHYFRDVAALPIGPDTQNTADIVGAMNESGIAAIGTPDDAVAQIERLWKQAGGFGGYLFMAHDWADREATLRSYELVARYVMPYFQDQLTSIQASHDWAAANRGRFLGRAGEAVMQAISDYAERGPGG